MDQLRVRGSRLVRLSDEWILSLILHFNLAWLICALILFIGHATKASWRPIYSEDGTESGLKLFWLAFTTVFSLWFRILLLTLFCELVNILSWICVYTVAVWFGTRRPLLLPMMDQVFLAAGIDLLPIVRRYQV